MRYNVCIINLNGKSIMQSNSHDTAIHIIDCATDEYIAGFNAYASDNVTIDRLMIDANFSESADYDKIADFAKIYGEISDYVNLSYTFENLRTYMNEIHPHFRFMRVNDINEFFGYQFSDNPANIDVSNIDLSRSPVVRMFELIRNNLLSEICLYVFATIDDIIAINNDPELKRECHESGFNVGDSFTNCADDVDCSDVAHSDAIELIRHFGLIDNVVTIQPERIISTLFSKLHNLRNAYTFNMNV